MPCQYSLTGNNKNRILKCLVITSECLQYLRGLTTSLEEAKDIVQAVSEITTLTSSLKQVREKVDSYHSRGFETVSNMCNEVGTTLSMPRVYGLSVTEQAYQHLISLNTLELPQFQFWTIFFLSLTSGLVHIKKQLFKVYTWYHQCW